MMANFRMASGRDIPPTRSLDNSTLVLRFTCLSTPLDISQPTFPIFPGDVVSTWCSAVQEWRWRSISR